MESNLADHTLIVQQWTQVISTQMHFNEMLMQLRAIGISVIMASYGAAALTLIQHQKKTIQLAYLQFHPSKLVILFGLLVTSALFALDYCYYYQMLLSAVEVGYQMELNAAIKFDLTRQIGFDTSESTANWILRFFYGVPFLVGSILLFIPIRVEGAHRTEIDKP